MRLAFERLRKRAGICTSKIFDTGQSAVYLRRDSA